MEVKNVVIVLAGGILLLLLFADLFSVSESFSLNFLNADSFPFLFEGDAFGFVLLGVLCVLVVVGMLLYFIKDGWGV